MNVIKRFFGHLYTVNKHRWWVFYYCCKAGIPFRGLVHDLSKFSPIEFFEGVKYYSGNQSPIDNCKAQEKYSKAWLHHRGRNKHHYEYWQDNFDKGGESLCMPDKYAIEMLCDYLGAGRAYMGKDFSFQAEYDWWNNKKDRQRAMHYQQKRFISISLDNLRAGSKNFRRTIRSALAASKIFPC